MDLPSFLEGLRGQLKERLGISGGIRAEINARMGKNQSGLPPIP